MAKCNIGSLERRCKKGFLDDYVKYTRHLESPVDFNIWVGISLVGVALGRRCWATKGYMKLYPNTYIVLVGPSAIGKGVALGAGHTILLESIGNKVPVFSQRGTVESLIEYLAHQYEDHGTSDCLLNVPEFATFLGKSTIDPSLLHCLTDYYDCPEKRSYSTRSHGEEVMYRLCLNMQAGSTPEWIKNSLPEDSIGGGFLSRLLIVHRQEGAPKNPFPVIDAPTQLARDNCINDLRIINELRGEFEWDSSARDMYTEWYHNYLDAERESAGMNMDGYYGRKAAMMVKLAMICSAGLGDDLRIKEGDIESAREILAENEKYASKIVKYMSLNESGKKINKVRNIIRKAGKLGHSDLMRKVSYMMDSAELQSTIDTLLSGEEIEAVIDTSSKRSRKIYTFKK